MRTKTEVWERWQYYKESPYTHILYIFRKRGAKLTEDETKQIKDAARKLKILSRDIKSRYIGKYIKTITEE